MSLSLKMVLTSSRSSLWMESILKMKCLLRNLMIQLQRMHCKNIKKRERLCLFTLIGMNYSKLFMIISVNTKYKLLQWSGDGVVAEGRIAFTNPKAKVHHVPLGGSCWKVWIDRVLMEKVDLIRPNDEMYFLEDAIGSTVVWFSKCIVLCD